MNQSTSSCGEYSSWKRSNSWTWLLIENHCNRLYQRLTHHQTPKLERIYTMGPCMIHYIDNSWKVAPISTSTAPIATYHCTFMDVNVKCCVDFHSTTHMSSLTDPMTLHSSPIHVWVLDRKALENNPHIGRFDRWKFQLISKPGWLTNWIGIQN